MSYKNDFWNKFDSQPEREKGELWKNFTQNIVYKVSLICSGQIFSKSCFPKVIIKEIHYICM